MTIQSDGTIQGVDRPMRPAVGRRDGGEKSKMPHKMLLRDSESTVHRIKILMQFYSEDYISRESNPGFHCRWSV